MTLQRDLACLRDVWSTRHRNQGVTDFAGAMLEFASDMRATGRQAEFATAYMLVHSMEAAAAIASSSARLLRRFAGSCNEDGVGGWPEDYNAAADREARTASVILACLHNALFYGEFQVEADCESVIRELPAFSYTRVCDRACCRPPRPQCIAYALFASPVVVAPPAKHSLDAADEVADAIAAMPIDAPSQ